RCALQTVPSQAAALAQPQPFLDPPGVVTEAVLIENPLRPLSTDLAQWAARQQDCIFDGDILLIVEAIGGPELNLRAGERPRIHQVMKRMPVVVLLFADLAQSRGKFVGRPELH